LNANLTAYSRSIVCFKPLDVV